MERQEVHRDPTRTGRPAPRCRCRAQQARGTELLGAFAAPCDIELCQGESRVPARRVGLTARTLEA